MKKIRNKLIILIVIIILLIVGIITGILLSKNYRLISKLEKLAKENGNTTNYSYVMNYSSGGVSKYWIKDGAFYANIIENIAIAEVYEDNDNKIYLMKRNDGSVYYSINGESNEQIGMKCVPAKFYGNSESTYSDIKKDVKTISEEEFIGKDAYLVQTKENEKYWIEKATGFIIGWTMGDEVISVTFEFNNVTDQDLKIPDTSKYK